MRVCLPTSKPNNLPIYNAGGQLNIAFVGMTSIRYRLHLLLFIKSCPLPLYSGYPIMKQPISLNSYFTHIHGNQRQKTKTNFKRAKQ